MTPPAPPARGVGAAALRYTALRFGVFVGCFAVVVAIVLPLTGGDLGLRLLSAALAAAVASVPLSLYLGRGLRGELAAAIAAAADRRRQAEDDYDARVRAARPRPADVDPGA